MGNDNHHGSDLITSGPGVADMQAALFRRYDNGDAKETLDFVLEKTGPIYVRVESIKVIHVKEVKRGGSKMSWGIRGTYVLEKESKGPGLPFSASYCEMSRRGSCAVGQAVVHDIKAA